MEVANKEQWLNELLEQIRDKNLKTPLKLNSATTIYNLDRELELISNAVMHYEDPKILQHFKQKLITLNKL